MLGYINEDDVDAPDRGWPLLARNKINANLFKDTHQTLVNLLLNDGGLGKMVDVLGQAIGQSLFVANISGVVLAGHAASPLEAQFSKLMTFWSTRNELLPHRLLQQQALQFELDLVPLVVQREIMGLLVTQATGDHQTHDLLRQNANVITLALLKFIAAQEMVNQQRQELLEALLNNDHGTSRQLIDQARLIGWEFSSKPVVLLLNFWQTHHQLPERALNQAKLRRISDQIYHVICDVLEAHCAQSIVAPGSNGFIILPHLTTPLPEAQEQAKTLMKMLIDGIDAAKIKVGYAIAGGGFHAGLDGLQQSYQEAQQALDVGTRLEMRRPIWFEEIYLYLLLERSGRNEEVRDWVRRTLGPLAEYDRRNKTEMLHTLESYFDSNQTLQEAARMLHIHPNTLKYRLGRIEQILGQDPFKGENQLRFYLATKMARLLK